MENLTEQTSAPMLSYVKAMESVNDFRNSQNDQIDRISSGFNTTQHLASLLDDF